jgi:hypothetical protein
LTPNLICADIRRTWAAIKPRLFMFAAMKLARGLWRNRGALKREFGPSILD